MSRTNEIIKVRDFTHKVLDLQDGFTRRYWLHLRFNQHFGFKSEGCGPCGTSSKQEILDLLFQEGFMHFLWIHKYAEVLSAFRYGHFGQNGAMILFLRESN